jgi:hypothetical protein
MTTKPCTVFKPWARDTEAAANLVRVVAEGLR